MREDHEGLDRDGKINAWVVGQARRVRAAGRRRVSKSIVAETSERDHRQSERALKSVEEITGTGEYEVGVCDLKREAHRKVERR